MCGIAGILGPGEQVLREALSRMTAAQAHRGPDDAGELVLPFGRGAVGLGHRRLSILDLSPLGHQPMQHERTGNILSFNGEIYNFRELRGELEREGETFRGGSDSEVLLAGLARHAEAFLPRLEGMYAFAFLDGSNQRLLLARDPAGIKPLYLARAGGSLLFASEVRALLASGLVPRKLDPRGLAGLLAYGAVQEPLTLFRDVTELTPGCWQAFAPTEDGWTTPGPQPFWRYPPPREIEATDAIAVVRQTVERAVASHLVSDVPVGIFLSSGLDSTIIAGVAARHDPRPRCFTVGFADQPDPGEQELAAESARLFGLEHTLISISVPEAEAACRAWLAAIDQPSVDGLNVFLISRAVREKGIKVSLSGLGGDELFGGYPSFQDVPRLRRWFQRLRFLPARAQRALMRMLSLGRPPSFRAKLMDMAGGDGSLPALYFQRRRLMSNSQMAGLGLSAAALGLTPDFLPSEAIPDLANCANDSVRAISRLEFACYQRNTLLRDADANGMASGLEIRVPMLDQRLVDLAQALPGRVRLPRHSPGKYLLRRAFPDLLRPDLAKRPKRGFTLPLSRWMRTSLRSLCDQAATGAKELGGLRPTGVDEVFREFHSAPESPAWSRALALCVLGDYVRRAGATC